MTTFFEEVAGDQRVNGGSVCLVCQWIDALSPPNRIDVRRAMSNKAFSAASIHRNMERHGYEGKEGTVRRHRKENHT